MRPQTLAVIGTTGFLGRTFVESRNEDIELVPIDRRLADLTKSFELHLRDVFKRNPVSTAIVCVAISSPDECKAQPELSQKVNVEGTIRLFRLLKDLGIKPVFFSTDHVYDGTKGFYNESDPYNPVTLYGKQKVEAESFLRDNFDDFLILRTSKQVSTRIDKKNILAEMALKLLNGRSIRCATDHAITPIFAEDIVKITLSAIRKGLSGPLHLATGEAVTRLELGHRVSDFFNVPRSMVEPCSINDFNFIEVRPPHCTLDPSLLHRVLNPTFMTVEEGLARLVRTLPLERAPYANAPNEL